MWHQGPKTPLWPQVTLQEAMQRKCVGFATSGTSQEQAEEKRWTWKAVNCIAHDTMVSVPKVRKTIMRRLWKSSASAFFEPLHALVVWKVLFRIITGPFLMQRLCVWIVQNTKKCLFNFLFTSRYAQNDVFCKWKVLCSKIYHTYFYSNFLQLPKTIIGPPTMVLVWSICSQTKGSY